MKRVVIFGTSANPFGTHHEPMLRALAERPEFDQVIVLPCGPRDDGKETTNDVAPIHRAVMTDLACRGIPKVEVDLSDLERNHFTRTVDLDARFRADGIEPWHLVGADLVKGGAFGNSQIHRWKEGVRAWRDLNFVVATRPGYPLSERDMPPHRIEIDGTVEGSSTNIRQRIFNHQSITGLVRPVVEEYIKRHGLYLGREPATATILRIEQPRLLVVADRYRETALRFAETLAPFNNPDHANMIVVLGGDGTMLRAVREHWRKRLPFVGFNFGGRGFLLNDIPEATLEALQGPFEVRQSPLLYIEAELRDGTQKTSLAVNDAYVKTVPCDGYDPSGWFEVRVNGQVKIPKLVGDGVLVSTAAGSTGYARAMGVHPFEIGTNKLALVGNNVDEPLWDHAYLPIDDAIKLSSVDPTDPPKRPIHAYADSVSMGLARSMSVRVSRIAAAEIAHRPGYTLSRKLERYQFPPIGG